MKKWIKFGFYYLLDKLSSFTKNEQIVSKELILF
jgi:hypothetical protein